MEDASVNLPPGFFFSPTDEELVLHFLHCKASLIPCHPNIIPDLDLSLLDPWELNGMLKLSLIHSSIVSIIQFLVNIYQFILEIVECYQL